MTLLIVVETKGAASLQVAQGTGEASTNRGAGALLSEVLLGIRTVASLTTEPTFYEAYSMYIGKLRRDACKLAVVSAFLSGFAQALVFFVLGGMYLYGGYLLQVSSCATQHTCLHARSRPIHNPSTRTSAHVRRSALWGRPAPRCFPPRVAVRLTHQTPSKGFSLRSS